MLKTRYSRVLYCDDGIEIPGILVRRLFQRPLFLPYDVGCGFHSQTIYGPNKCLIHEMRSENPASEHIPEICPVCNNLSLKYSERRDFVGGFDYPWKCRCCGASGAESYNVHFAGHSLIVTEAERNNHS